MSTLAFGLETSCDECSASVVRYSAPDRYEVLSLATYSQIEEHKPYGGVVPEVASRNHLEQVSVIIQQAIQQAGCQYEDFDVISVTNRPGLVGALLVGVSAAKAIAYATHKKLMPVHHLEGHLISPWLTHPGQTLKTIPFPAIVLLVSGGHTQLHWVEHSPQNWDADILKNSLLGKSLDDAAGEAFDKTAKILGFPYPGGKWIDEQGRLGDPRAFSFPRALKQKTSLDFSFSGLKTSVMLTVQKLTASGELTDPSTKQSVRADLCASLQEAILDSLISKSGQAVRFKQAKSLIVVGGVSANSRLRERLAAESSVPVFFPKLEFCTDNAAMIAAVGANRHARGESTDDFFTLNAFAVES